MDNAILCLFLPSTLSPTQAATPGTDPVLIFSRTKQALLDTQAAVRGDKRNPSLPFVTQEGIEGDGFTLEL